MSCLSEAKVVRTKSSKLYANVMTKNFLLPKGVERAITLSEFPSKH